MNSASAINYIKIAASFSAIITSLEFIFLYKRDFSKFVPWEISRLSIPIWKCHVADNFLHLCFSNSRVVAILFAQLLSAILLFFPGMWGAIGAAGIAVTSLMIVTRSPYGLEGSDQLLLLISICLAIALVWPLSAPSCLAFISMQLCVCYETAGLVKLFSAFWRDGTAVRGVMSTVIYGNPVAYRVLAISRLNCIVVSWSLIVWECSFPFAILASHQVFLPWLFCGMVFHIATALVMGLNKFAVVFIGAYPALIFCNDAICEFIAQLHK